MQSGNFAANVFASTSGAVQSAALSPTMQTGTAVSGPKLIPQQNGGLPLPSQFWWQSDPLYSYIYIQSYNYVISQYNNTVTGIPIGNYNTRAKAVYASPIRSIPQNASYNDAYSMALNDGDAIIDLVNKTITSNRRQTVEQQFIDLSIQMLQQMSVRMNQLAVQLGDNMYDSMGSIGTGVQDQSIPTIN